MATLTAQTPDGHTLTIPVPEGTDPKNYGAMVDDAVKHYSTINKDQSIGQQAMEVAGNVGKGALNVLAAPFQITGEAIRHAGTTDPLQVATAQDPRGLRAPSILQQLIPNLKTPEPPADPFMQSAMGLKGITTTASKLTPSAIGDLVQSLRSGSFNSSSPDLSNALQAGKEVVQGQPNAVDSVNAMALGLGTGEAGNAPFDAAVKMTKGATNLVPKFAKLANIIKDVNPEVVQQAEKFDVPISAAGQTGGGTQASIENVLSRMPFSKDIMLDKAKQTLNALDQNVRQPLIQGAKEDTEIAPAIQDSIANASKTAYANAKSLYENAANALSEGQSIPLTSVQQKAKEILSSQQKLKDLGAQSSGVMDILKKISGGDDVEEAISQMVPKGATPEQIMKARQTLEKAGYTGMPAPNADYQTLQGLRSELNSRIAQADAAYKTNTPGMKFQSSPEAGIYKQLKSALDQDIKTFADKEGGPFKQALDQANSTYSQFKDAFANNKVIKSIVSEQDPSKVVDKVLNLDNPNVITAIKTNLPAPVLQDVQKKLIQRMTEAKPGQFSPAHFVTQYEKIGEDTLNSFLGPSMMEKIKPLYVLSKASTQAERLGANASGTGQAMMAGAGIMGPMLQLFRGHPVTAATTALGEAAALPMAAKAYNSQPVTNLLTNRTNVIGNVANTVGQAAPIAKTSQNMQELINQLKQKYENRRKF